MKRGSSSWGGGMSGVEVRGLTKTFGRVTAVRGMSFTAPAGKVTGFLGPNGSGKTTTLRIVLGLVHPTAGEALAALLRQPGPRPGRDVRVAAAAPAVGRRARA